jgi:VanZ family protein
MENYVPFVLIPFRGWGVRRHLIRRDDYSSLKRATLSIGISCFFLTEMARSFYRPYIYARGIDDYLIADTIGNSLGTITAVFMILTMAGRGTNRDWWLVAMVLVGLIGYEFTNLTGSHHFDSNDVWATLIFGVLSVLLYARILRRHGRRRPRSAVGSG